MRSKLLAALAALMILLSFAGCDDDSSYSNRDMRIDNSIIQTSTIHTLDNVFQSLPIPLMIPETEDTGKNIEDEISLVTETEADVTDKTATTVEDIIAPASDYLQDAEQEEISEDVLIPESEVSVDDTEPTPESVVSPADSAIDTQHHPEELVTAEVTPEVIPEVIPEEVTNPETGIVAVPEQITNETDNAEPEVIADASNCDYVLNKNSKKIHYPTCSSVKQMAAHNTYYFIGTRDEAVAMGYDPCGRCKP